MDEPRPPATPPPPPGGFSEASGGDPEGPPPPPVVPSPAPGAPRRRRWPVVLALLLVVAVGVLVMTRVGEEATPVGLPEGEVDEPADPPEGDDGRAEGDDGTPEGETAPAPLDPEAALEPLDLDALDGVDLEYGRLLTDIDASERTMIAFQEGLADTFTAPDSPEAALELAGEIAAESQAGLLEVRGRLAEELDDPGADLVRELYVDHLDSWEVFMAAVADDPRMVFQQGEAGFTVGINATADAFARALEAELPDDVDGEVARFADGILDRGFRGFGYADV